MQNLVIEEVERVYRLAEEVFNVELTRPSVVFNKRLRTTAGRAFYDTNVVEFSTKVMEANGMDFINETPAHEAAHLIADTLFGHRGHGKPWKQVMVALGSEPNTRHSMKVATRRRFLYELGEGSIKLSTVRHNRVQKGTVYVTRGGETISKENFIKEIAE